MALTIVDHYPGQDASGVYLNDVVWAQFSHPLNTGTVDSINFAITDNEYYPVDGTVEVHGVSGNIDDAIVMFIPTDGFVRNTRYIVTIATNIEDKNGVHLSRDNFIFFTTGNTAASGNIGDSIYDIDPSGFTASGTAPSGPTATGVLDSPLTVVSTTPDYGGTNKARNIPYIAIKFNDILSSSIDLSDNITITSKGILE